MYNTNKNVVYTHRCIELTPIIISSNTNNKGQAATHTHTSDQPAVRTGYTQSTAPTTTTTKAS